MSGYVYMAVNDTFPHLMKIGCTSRNVHVRVAELNGTGVPGETVPLYYAATSNHRELERLVHSALGAARSSKKREFFEVSPVEGRRIIREVARRNGIRLSNEWSDDKLDENDRFEQLTRAEAELAECQEIYHKLLDMRLTCGANPFKRGLRIEIDAKIRIIQDRIEECEREILILS